MASIWSHNSLLELSKFIAQKGHKVSFISITRNIDRLPKIPQHLSSLITLVKHTLPVDDHIPTGAEATMDVKTADIQYLTKAAMIDSSDPWKEPEDYTISPEWVKFPTRVAFRSYEFNWIIEAGLENDSGLSDVKLARLVIPGSDVIFLRQCLNLNPNS
ncbi:hypothetical protein LguiB_009684 [Lonicera macranthoides]